MSEDNLDKLLDQEMQKEFKPKLIKPSGVAAAVESATNEDTERATQMMEAQLRKIIEGLEKDIASESEVRRTVNRRIHNLTHALETARAAVEVLEL